MQERLFYTETGYLIDRYDQAQCGYCGREDSACVMAVDQDQQVSCYKCAISHGFFTWSAPGSHA